MPPLKTYVFHKPDDKNITITILAHSFESAMYRLIYEVKHPADYQLKQS